MAAASSSSSKAPAGDGSQSSSGATWTESDELKLLLAVEEIAGESVEEFNPREDQFARIQRKIGKNFTRSEILGKVKELRRRYEEKCFKIQMGENGGSQDGNGAVFDVSHKIWGLGEKYLEKKWKWCSTKKRTKKGQ